MVLFARTKDWKNFLALSDEKRLNEILERASEHRGAYKNADNVKNAQLWCALLELAKENIKLLQRLQRLEYIIGGMTQRYEKDKEELLKSLKGL